MILNIIHLPERADREAHFKQQCADHGIEYKVWPGIRVPGQPRAGISRAYKAVVRDAMERGLPYIAIADDDFLLTAEGAWEYFKNMMPNDFDLYLGGISGGRVGRIVTMVKQKSSNPLFHDNSCPLVWHSPEEWCGTFMFVVNARFYEKFLTAPEMFNIDRWLSNHCRPEPKTILCYPMPFICFDSHSDNSDKFMEHKKYFKKYELYDSQTIG